MCEVQITVEPVPVPCAPPLPPPPPISRPGSASVVKCFVTQWMQLFSFPDACSYKSSCFLNGPSQLFRSNSFVHVPSRNECSHFLLQITTHTDKTRSPKMPCGKYSTPLSGWAGSCCRCLWYRSNCLVNVPSQNRGRHFLLQMLFIRPKLSCEHPISKSM